MDEQTPHPLGGDTSQTPHPLGGAIVERPQRIGSVRYIFVAICATFSGLLAACGHAQALPATVTAFTALPATTTTAAPPITVDITPDTVVLLAAVPQLSQCAEWTETALEAGWDTDHLHRLGYIIWRESRCQPDAFNGTDPSGGSRGLVQINGYWCRPSRYHPTGWLQAQGVLGHCDDLHDPLTNLTAALAIYGYAEGRGCGWSPWTTRNTRWC